MARVSAASKAANSGSVPIRLRVNQHLCGRFAFDLMCWDILTSTAESARSFMGERQAGPEGTFGMKSATFAHASTYERKALCRGGPRNLDWKTVFPDVGVHIRGVAIASARTDTVAGMSRLTLRLEGRSAVKG